jgi:calcineurin-like phosphoesterase family protein
MSHYPMLTWNAGHYGSWMFHGHSHGFLRDTGENRIDVGVDTHPNLEPYSFDEILEKMQGRKFRGFDHHGTRGETTNE